MANIEEKVENLVNVTIQNIGYELYDVQYVKEGKDYYLRIFIDKPNGVDLNDCEKVSDAISNLLDEADYIKEQYYLEVSSPGIERILRKDKHLQANLGVLVELKLFRQMEKKKTMQGILKDFNNQTITIDVNGELMQVERKNISVIKTVYEW